MRLFLQYLRGKAGKLAAFFLFTAIFIASFALYRLPLTARLRYIWLPGIFPSFCQSCIAAMGMCWKSGVSAEVIGLPDHSVGDALYRAKITLSTPDVFAWTLVIVVASALLSHLAARGLRAAKSRLCGEVTA